MRSGLSRDFKAKAMEQCTETDGWEQMDQQTPTFSRREVIGFHRPAPRRLNVGFGWWYTSLPTRFHILPTRGYPMAHFLRAFATIAITGSMVLAATLDAPRALPEGQLPKDERLGDLAHLDGYHPFHPVKSAEAWKKRAAELRQQVLLAEGLWPMPEKTPLNAQVFGKVTRDGYTVEKVILESYPGHYVTGSLYRPVGRTGKLPAVLNPHGHWPGGRYHDLGEGKIRGEIAIGAERFEVSGRHPLQARCVQQARMGCVAFLYDMEGYADSVQFKHRAGVRPSMNTMENFGYFSPQAELRLIHMMGLQTWNQVRALDFICSLPEVDQSRIAVTGASGGGTQTLILTAIDDRIALSVPCVMPSTAMQGGCTCENADYLRIGAGNIDLAAMAAPRPTFLVGAHDWTIDLETKGLPDLKALYAMLGQKGKVDGKVNAHFQHNYNAVSRSLMETRINRYFKLGLPEPVIEQDFVPLTKDEISVWDDKHPKPTGDQVGDAHERKLVKYISDEAAKQLAALTPKDTSTLENFRGVIGAAWDVIFARRQLSTIGEIQYDLSKKVQHGDYLMMSATLTVPSTGQQLPTLFIHPKDKSRWNGEVVVWVDENGKNGMLDGRGTPSPRVTELLNAGYSIAGLDMMGQGEFTTNGESVKQQRRVSYADKKTGAEPEWRLAACYTYGYNSPLFTQRVHDVMTMVKFVATNDHAAKKVHLVGLDPVSGAIAAAARSRCENLVDQTIVNASFRFGSLNEMTHPMFVPGAVKYGDTPALIALCAPGNLTVIGDAGDLAKAAYSASGSKLSTADENAPLKGLLK
jgi:dienelactone hydrolase